MDVATHPEPEDLNTLDDDAFRRAVRSWIEANYPPELRNPPKRLHWRDCKPWYFQLAEKGWLCPSWPREHGGMGLSAGKQIILVEEYERHGVARTNDHGILMVGPLLIAHGTQEQRDFFLPKIRAGEHIWCQGYSEPNAGSDLASLRTEAIPDGDDWIINGSKIWTTLANDANWIFVLVRTDKTAKKQEGISFLLVPMDLPGITVRPIYTIDLHDEFCEVFFDNVRVPRKWTVGQVNQGWTMAKALLGHERIYLGSAKLSQYALDRLKSLADRLGITEDPDFIARYTGLKLEIADLKSLHATYVDIVRRGEELGPDVSMLKIIQTELFQKITDTMLEFAGENAALLDPMEGNRELNPAGLFLQARPSTIYGGSNEIQRNILAKNVLRLPG